MGSIKDRNGVDLTEAEDILRRGSKNTQKVKVRVKLLSCVRLLMTPWTAAHQAPPSLRFSKQEYWSGFRYADDTTLMAESKEGLKSLLMRVKEESERAGLRLNFFLLNFFNFYFLI